MLKIIHTADWHIGQTFYGYDRKYEHRIFFDWLRNCIHNTEADVLLVAGDVFDSPNPSADSQELYYRILTELHFENPQLQIVIIAGNHDSAGRIEAPHPILKNMNIQVRGSVKRTSDDIDYENLIIPLRNRSNTEKAWCLAVPYLRQGDYPSTDNFENENTYTSGIKNLYRTLSQKVSKIRKPGEAVIAMGHLQATGSEISENDPSERSIVGGLECVPPESFDSGINYTALGHLHKAQRVSNRNHVRYAGSPLPMSFAEKNYKQGVNLVIFEEEQPISIERIEFTPPVRLISLPGKPMVPEEVLKEIELLPDGDKTADSPYLQVNVSVIEPDPALKFKIESALENKAVRLTSIITSNPTNNGNGTYDYNPESLQDIHPLDLAERIYLKRNGETMPDELKSLIQDIIKEIYHKGVEEL